MHSPHSPNNRTAQDAATQLIAKARMLAGLYWRWSDLTLTVDASLDLHPRREEFEVIVGELVDNAFKFSRVGDAVEVVWKAQRGGRVLIVEDHGCGMHPEELNVLWQALQKQPAETLKHTSGLLRISAMLPVYGAVIAIESARGTGSCVEIFFPARESNMSVLDTIKMPPLW